MHFQESDGQNGTTAVPIHSIARLKTGPGYVSELNFISQDESSLNCQVPNPGRPILNRHGRVGCKQLSFWTEKEPAGKNETLPDGYVDGGTADVISDMEDTPVLRKGFPPNCCFGVSK